jgi:hypothetical protein
LQEAVLSIEWTGDLDDDCTAHWSGLILRAEWMNGIRWWWAVSEELSGQEIDSSNNDQYFGVKFTSGSAARQAAKELHANIGNDIRPREIPTVRFGSQRAGN